MLKLLSLNMIRILLLILLTFTYSKYSFSKKLSEDDLLKMSPNQLIISAKNGDPLAQLWLGDALYNGSIPNWKSFNVCEWYYKSAQQNNADAAIKLYNYLKYITTTCPKLINLEKPNLDRSYWLLKAARLNNSEAQLYLYYESKNETTKLRWLKKSVKNNHSPAIEVLASLHLSGSLVEKNVKTAIELLNKASKLDPKDEYPDIQLARIYSNKMFLQQMSIYKGRLKLGEIKKMDDTTAKLLKTFNYSNYFDIEKAISSSKTCIEKKLSYTCYSYLVQFYSKKMYGNIDFDEAMFWLDEAEEVLKNSDHHSSILTTKGLAYLNWDNLKVNKVKARKYFLKAIELIKKSKSLSMNDRIKTIEDWLQYTY